MKYATAFLALALLAQAPTLPSVAGRYVWRQDGLTASNLDGSTSQYLMNANAMEAFQENPNAALGSLWEWANQFHPELVPTIEARIQDAPRSEAAQLVWNRLRSVGSTPETDPQVWAAVEYLR